MFIEPTAEQITELLEGGHERPVVMLNLLKFGAGDGEATYRRYGEAVLPMVAELGGRLVWQGRADSVVIGDSGDGWDAVALVEYPSRQAFLGMVTSPEYQAIAGLRADGLADSRLIACTQQYPAGEVPPGS